MQNLHHGSSVFTDESVIDVLTNAAGVDQTFLPQHTELLRQRWLAYTQVALKLADAELGLRQATQQNQAIGVRQHLEQGASPFGRSLQGNHIGGWHGHPVTSQGIAFRIHAKHYVDKYIVCQ